MKNFVNRFALAIMLCALASVVSLADGKRKEVTFPTDVTVSGTLVKKGTYTLNFDEQTGELTIIENKKTIAKTTARLEKRQDKALQTKVNTITQGDSEILRSIAFRGDSQAFVVAEGGAHSVTGNR